MNFRRLTRRVFPLETLVIALALALAFAFSLAAQSAPTPAPAAAPITVLAVAGGFYDGSSHHGAMRLGAFIPVGSTNWIGMVGDMGLAKDSPTNPKYALGGRFLQKVATMKFGSVSIPVYAVAAIGGTAQASTVKELIKGAGSVVTTVFANGGTNVGYQASTGGGLDIQVKGRFHLHPFAEYAHGSLTGNQISVGLTTSGQFQIQRGQ